MLQNRRADEERFARMDTMTGRQSPISLAYFWERQLVAVPGWVPDANVSVGSRACGAGAGGRAPLFRTLMLAMLNTCAIGFGGRLAVPPRSIAQRRVPPD